MLCIRNPKTDPYYNIAAEEYVLKNFTEDCFMLWRSKPSIIVGKHQNTLAEINFRYVKENNIDVVRRLSGGGTVFHDLGNLNFTFIQNVEDEKNLVDFKKYTTPIIKVLNDLGVNAKHEGRNDIMINGRKISGNAEHVYKKRVLHHGTLLFSSVISDLSKALKVNPLKYQDRGVKSVRSRVTNIVEHLDEKITIEQFEQKLYENILNTSPGSRYYDFTDQDKAEIEVLANSKYKTWEWNYAYSPKYNFEKEIHTPQGFIEINLSIEKGIIKNSKINSDLIPPIQEKVLNDLLIGIEHREDVISKTLQNASITFFPDFIELSDFINNLF